MGHVNNVMYGHYFDMARLDFLIQKFGKTIDLRNGRFILIMVHTQYDFLFPSFLEERLYVTTSLSRIGHKSIQFEQNIVDDKGIVRVTGTSIMSTYDRETGKSFELNEEWRRILEQP